MRAEDFAALHFPGGHAPGMKPYCESGEVARLAKEVRPNDTFLFYVASHGMLDETTNRFLLVPARR